MLFPHHQNFAFFLFFCKKESNFLSLCHHLQNNRQRNKIEIIHFFHTCFTLNFFFLHALLVSFTSLSCTLSLYYFVVLPPTHILALAFFSHPFNTYLDSFALPHSLTISPVPHLSLSYKLERCCFVCFCLPLTPPTLYNSATALCDLLLIPSATPPLVSSIPRCPATWQHCARPWQLRKQRLEVKRWNLEERKKRFVTNSISQQKRTERQKVTASSLLQTVLAQST